MWFYKEGEQINEKMQMEMREVSEWINIIQEEREQKDMFFLNNYNSPISDEKRRFFEGLDYYPPDPDLRFELELFEHKEKEYINTRG